MSRSPQNTIRQLGSRIYWQPHIHIHQMAAFQHISITERSLFPNENFAVKRTRIFMTNNLMTSCTALQKHKHKEVKFSSKGHSQPEIPGTILTAGSERLSSFRKTSNHQSLSQACRTRFLQMNISALQTGAWLWSSEERTISVKKPHSHSLTLGEKILPPKRFPA